MSNSESIDALTQKLYEETPEDVRSVGYGYKEVNGQLTNELSIIFGVAEKKPLSAISQGELLPTSVTLENGTVLSTDVIEIPEIIATYCYDDNDLVEPVSQHRASRNPYIGGIRISRDIINNPSFVSTGTMGCICLDTTDNTLVALTNAHVGPHTARVASLQSSSFNNKQVVNYQALRGSHLSTMRLKRYMPFYSTGNTIDAAILAITDSSFVNTLTAFKQLNLNYNQNLEFATTSEIDSIVSNKNPIFKAGARTGPVGWPGSAPWGSETCSLTATQLNFTTGVSFTDYLATYSVTFNNCIVYRGTNTVASDGGDSGSVVCALFNPSSPTLSAWKIIGLTFAAAVAADNAISVACRIDNVCTTMQLTSWDGQSTALTNLNNESLRYLPGKSSTSFFDENGKRYWQVSYTQI
jgi:hypothetical protein